MAVLDFFKIVNKTVYKTTAFTLLLLIQKTSDHLTKLLGLAGLNPGWASLILRRAWEPPASSYEGPTRCIPRWPARASLQPEGSFLTTFCLLSTHGPSGNHNRKREKATCKRPLRKKKAQNKTRKPHTHKKKEICHCTKTACFQICFN